MLYDLLYYNLFNQSNVFAPILTPTAIRHLTELHWATQKESLHPIEICNSGIRALQYSNSNRR